MSHATCTMPGCDRRQTARGWCFTHYERWRKTGDPGPAEIRQRLKAQPGPQCAQPGCDRPSRTRGMCKTHADRARIKERQATEVCTIVNCDKGVVASGMCRNHLYRRDAGKPMYGSSPKPLPLPPAECAVDGCDRAATTKGWCYTHYVRALNNGGDPGPAYIKYKPKHQPGAECTVEGCGTARYALGLCAAHYSRLRKSGITGPPETGVFKYPADAACSVDACDRRPRARGMCQAHYLRWFNGSQAMDSTISKRNWAGAPCPFPGCTRKASGEGYCNGHRAQLKRGQALRPLQVKTDPRTRDAEGRKWCITCLTWKPVDDFSKERSRPDGLHTRCKRCMRSRALQAKFGIDIDRYERLLASQGGGCAICRAVPTKHARAFAVDHDHSCCPTQETCGECVRGILCSRCNLMIGSLGDDPEVLVSMARYLRQCQGMLL